jgi:cytochrome P450
MTIVTLPPGPSTSRLVQGTLALLAPRRGIRRLRDRYGDAFTINVPVFGRAVVISDPADVKQLFLAGTDVADNLERNLGRVLGPGSLFALTGAEHRKQRKLLVPPFHGRRLAVYETIVEEETVRELSRWPEGRPFATLPSTMRITLNAILRAVFGAEGAEFAELRRLLPPFVALGSRLAVLPIPEAGLGRWSPWDRFRAIRREYDAVVERLITRAEQDARLDERDDVLALMLRSRYDDGSRMSHGEVADQLLTLLSAGHDDGHHARLGRGAAAPPPGRAAHAGRGGGRGRQRVPRGDDHRGAAHPAGHRHGGTAGHRRPPAARPVDAAEGLSDPGQHHLDPRQRVAVR